MQNNFPLEDFDSIILFENNKIYRKSTAVLKISKHLNGLWPLYYIYILFPEFIRDFIYDIIARNRYKWFGKREACIIPDEEVKEKFIN
jgi:predicted DCC family thiol-disulfide oxidoreductase YuxK